MRRLAKSVGCVGAGVVAVTLLLAGRAAADKIPADKLAEPALNDKLPAAEAAYLHLIHARIHRRWADNFVRLVGEQIPASNPLNEAGRTAEVDIVVGADGQLLSSRITTSSGFAGFDDAITEVIRDSIPFPRPPEAVRSDDDQLHVHWVFARDQRRCSGVTILHVQDPLEIAIPKLLRTGRGAEALARVTAARATGVHAEPMMSTLAMEWARASLHEPWASPRMVRLRADRGDTNAIAWLKAAVKRPELAAAAGEALAANKVPVCPLVKAAFDSQSWTDHQVAAQALATAGEAECAPQLIKLLENAKARPEARVVAAVALGPINDPAAKAALATAGKEEKSDAVRAAAILAQVRPNAGRGKVLAMVQIIRDPSAELRAAACAGIARAGGDSNLEDLYVLFKDSDARPSEATLRELDRLHSDAALTLVGRLARRPQLSVEKLAAQILIKRRARLGFSALKGYLDPATDSQLRGMALVAADDAQLASLAQDPKMGIWVYRANLAHGERDRAADWLLAHGKTMTPADLGEAMVDWLESSDSLPVATADARKTRR
jgi:TonB family protein